MASEKLVKQLLAINFSLHPSSAPADITAAHVVAKFWMQALAPFEDAEVEPIATRALESSTFPLKPADVVPKLAINRLGVVPWEEAFPLARQAALRREIHELPEGPIQDVARSMREAFLNRKVDDPLTILQAQFRDSYNAAVSRLIDEERKPGGMLAIGSANGVKAIEAKS